MLVVVFSSLFLVSSHSWMSENRLLRKKTSLEILPQKKGWMEEFLLWRFSTTPFSGYFIRLPFTHCGKKKFCSLLSIAEHYWTLLIITGHCWALLSIVEDRWALLIILWFWSKKIPMRQISIIFKHYGLILVNLSMFRFLETQQWKKFE